MPQLTRLLSPLCALAMVAQVLPAQGKGLVDRSSPLQVVESDPGERELRMTPVVRAVQRAADSVVSIYLTNRLAGGQPITEGQGSGVILDESGLIITNWHVIAPVLIRSRQSTSRNVTVKLRDGRQRKAKVLSSTPVRDLALLQMEASGPETFQPIEIARSSELMIGETVVAIGNPQGHANTVTSGVLSATGRSIQVRAPDGEVRTYSDLLQTDAAINGGNSGGALLDITGRLIGINNAMSASAENIGFAIPMDVVRKEFTRELLQSNSFVASGTSPWLGLEVTDQNGSVVIAEIVKGGPAQLAGLNVGDSIIKIGDQRVASSIDYLRNFLELRKGRAVRITVERQGRNLQVELSPMLRHEGSVLTSLGAKLDEVRVDADEGLVRAATIAFYRGSGRRQVTIFPAAIRINAVVNDGAADIAGFEAGDVLIGVIAKGRFGDREQPIVSLVDLAKYLESQQGKKVRLIVLRGDRDLIGTILVPLKSGRDQR